MTALSLAAWRAASGLALAALAASGFLCATVTAALAQDRAQVFVTEEAGFGRLVLTFPQRLDLPRHQVRYENGILAVEFEAPIDLTLPDVAVSIPEYVTIARVDPDKRGVRFGLRTAVTINHMQAGEQLFIDIMPQSWQGLPPSLPESVIAELELRARDAAVLAERQRKANDARTLKPTATVRVGRNPTFLRIQFDWNVPTEGRLEVREPDEETADGGDAAAAGNAGADGASRIVFDWPVPIDLYALKADLPAEVSAVENVVDADGTWVHLTMADGSSPRFYQMSETQFVVDVDIAFSDITRFDTEVARPQAAAPEAMGPEPSEEAESGQVQADITPKVSVVGSTVRLTFPFDRDVATAVFRRGDTVWMLFDTETVINPPVNAEPLAAIADGFSVFPAGDAQVVRLGVTESRLATLGSEGRAWVLSLGDVLLNPTAPLALSRHRNETGEYEMTADLVRPAKVHAFRDPVAGDVLTVVTAFAPAQGVVRRLDYVDFSALRSAHGLVLMPRNPALEVRLEASVAEIVAEGGLTLSSPEQGRTAGPALMAATRPTFVDLTTQRLENAAEFTNHQVSLITSAAEAEGAARDAARLKLAQFYLSNGYAYEALGVLDVLESRIASDEVRKPARLSRAIAQTLAGRPDEAIDILNASAFADEADAMLWRTIARADRGDYEGARADSLAAAPVLESYPQWVRHEFQFAAIRAAVETNDFELARELLAALDFATLDPEQATWFHLFAGRVAESEGHYDEALDLYGQVIAAEIRPTRAEAVYRTLLLLDRTGQIDLGKATETLAAEALLWRGDRLELDMLKLLADLYFRNRDYRLGFETVQMALQYHPETSASQALGQQAQAVFGNLYLDGMADQLSPVDALSLYYDFRQLTPAGARGDEMIRNLAQRLVKVDLLAQAAELLEYQIENRLVGAARASVAADLAVILIADRRPKDALRVLNETRLAELSPNLERRRRVLEAQAMTGAGRPDLALDLVSALQGREVDLLRIEALWASKQEGAAAELLEIMYDPGDPVELLNPPARMNIVRAAVGFVIGGDRLGLSRLRSKFGERMARAPEWPMFDFVTGDITTQSIGFRDVAREVSGLDSLNAFLDAYRELYANRDSPVPAGAAPPTDIL